jgi:hypothetical protein
VADTRSSGLVDDQFWHARAGGGVVLHLDQPKGDHALRIEGMGQFTNSALPATEKFYLGDRDRMRGYHIATTLGDTGVAGTVELSRYIGIEKGILEAISPSAFLDAGWAKATDDATNRGPGRSLLRGWQRQPHEPGWLSKADEGLVRGSSMRNLHLVLAFSLAAAAGANGDARARTSGGATPPGNHYGWCKGNGNPHSSGCATSTNGGTVNGNTGHAPPPTATEVPHPAGIVTGTYGQSFTGYAPVPPIRPQ